MEYYGNLRSEMLEFIPKSAKRLLEVGCGAGLFLKEVKRINSAEITYGVELFPEAAEKAKNNIDAVICGDYLSNSSLLPNDYFDVVIFNDVLEHFENPWKVLENVKTKLSKDGVVVASIPNVRFVLNLIELLFKKDWRYKQEGILDFTHLRFFTQKSAIRLFTDSGYEIVQVRGINPVKNLIFKVANLLTMGFFKDTLFLQFAIVAKRKN